VGGISGGLGLAILAVFLIGVAFGVVIIAAVASRREDRFRSFTGPAPDTATRGARRVFGLGARNTVTVTEQDPADTSGPADDLVASDGQWP
jgi:hypothetical protein